MEKIKNSVIETFKAGIIGCGRIGCSFDDDPKRTYIATHAGAYNNAKEINLVALADVDELKLKKYKDKFNVRSIYTDYREMLEKEKLDILSICTWNDTHYDITKEAVKANVKAIFCEKPIASKLEDAKKMVELCEKNNILLMIDHQRRFCTFHQAVKKFLEEKKLGDIQQTTFHYTAGIANTGSHMFDLLRFFFGDVEWIYAVKSKNPSPNEKDSNFDGIIHFKNNLNCSIQALDVKKFLAFDLDIIGTEGRFRLTHSGFDYEYDTTQESRVFSGYRELSKSNTSPIDRDMKREPMLNGVKHLIDCLKNNKTPISSGTDGIKSLELICAFHESARKNGKRIMLPLNKSSIEIKSR